MSLVEALRAFKDEQQELRRAAVTTPSPSTKTTFRKASLKKKWFVDKTTGKRAYADYRGEVHVGQAAFIAAMAGSQQKKKRKAISEAEE